MSKIWLESISSERLHMKQKCDKVAARDNTVLGRISRNIEFSKKNKQTTN